MIKYIKLATDKYCPVCEHWDVVCEGDSYDEDMVHLYMRCAECGTKFTLTYRIEGAYIEEEDE